MASPASPRLAPRPSDPRPPPQGCSLEVSEQLPRRRPMSQLRLDPLTGRWVVISTDRAERPFAFFPRSLPVEADPNRACPFCPGNEESTPPALEAYGPTGTWQVRV